MRYIKNAWQIFDNYLLARWQNRPSTAAFWYLPELANIKNKSDLMHYQQSNLSPIFLIDYRPKLQYSLVNADGIIVLPYAQPIGPQINPEAAFQYALGLHDQFKITQEQAVNEKFWHYVEYFLAQQSSDGMWSYQFDWYGSKAPWYSALAQARGAVVMLRAWLLSHNTIYLTAAKTALSKFTTPITQGGFLHIFANNNCPYFEEYPQTPSGVLNGFMSALMCIWEMKYWAYEPWLDELWQMGMASLQKMLPHYSNHWWSFYDLDDRSPIANVNSPRYHLLEIQYLLILSLLADAPQITQEYQKRVRQYDKLFSPLRATGMKFMRKILYK